MTNVKIMSKSQYPMKSQALMTNRLQAGHDFGNYCLEVGINCNQIEHGTTRI
jgi:hypothetical protein